MAIIRTQQLHQGIIYVHTFDWLSQVAMGTVWPCF